MALRGTLKDFGITDIFQLIVHQGKTGILHLRNKSQQVRIYFRDGDIARAENEMRSQRDLLGQVMVRAEMVSEQQLEKALDIQKSTLKRLGDILIEQGYVAAETVMEFTRLQTTETLFRLFLWNSGSYEFEAASVEKSSVLEQPLKAEALLMDGIRMYDEWPLIRKVISGYDLTFEVVKELEEEIPEEDFNLDMLDDDGFGDLDSAFGEFEMEQAPAAKSQIGSNERVVYGLIVADRDVQKIIDLSRLGEFETCKALTNLVNGEYIKIGARRHKPAGPALVGGIEVRQSLPIWPIISRVAMALGLVVVLLVVIKITSEAKLMDNAPHFVNYRETTVDDTISRVQEMTIRKALDSYYLSFGQYPPSLQELVRSGLLREPDIQYPWQQTFYYRRVRPVPKRGWLDPIPQKPYVLLPPLR